MPLSICSLCNSLHNGKYGFLSYGRCLSKLLSLWVGLWELLTADRSTGKTTRPLWLASPSRLGQNWTESEDAQGPSLKTGLFAKIKEIFTPFKVMSSAYTRKNRFASPTHNSTPAANFRLQLSFQRWKSKVQTNWSIGVHTCNLNPQEAELQRINSLSRITHYSKNLTSRVQFQGLHSGF